MVLCLKRLIKLPVKKYLKKQQKQLRLDNADKITAKPHNKDEVINEIPKERYISPKERQKIIDELKLA